MRFSSSTWAGLPPWIFVLIGCCAAPHPPTDSRLRLSTPTEAAITHWETRRSFDPAVIRAQYHASNAAEAHALDVWVDNNAAYAEFANAVIHRFGESAARCADGPLGEDTKRTSAESVKWMVDDKTAWPLDSPSALSERRLDLVDGKWLQPISVWVLVDDQRLLDLAKETTSVRQLTAGVTNHELKDPSEVKAEQLKRLPQSPEPGANNYTGPPAFLPDTNPTTPAGAVASFALAILKRDSEALPQWLVAADQREKEFTRATLDLIKAEFELRGAIENSMGRAAADDYWKEAPGTSPIRIAIASLQPVASLQIQIEPDGKRARVSSAFPWALRKVGKRWRICMRDSIAPFNEIDGGAYHPKPPEIWLVPLERTAGMNRKLAAQIRSRELVTLTDVRETMKRRLETLLLSVDEDGQPTKPSQTKPD